MNITINNPKVVVVRDSTSLTKQQQNINKHIDTLVHLAKQSVLNEGNYRTPRHVFIKSEQKCTKENQTPNVHMALVNEAFDIGNLDENEVDNQMHQSEAKNGAITLDLVSDNEDEATLPAAQFNKPLESWNVTNVTNKEENDENKTITSAPSGNDTRMIVDNENADEEREVDANTSAITNAPAIDNRNKQVVIPNSTDDSVRKKRKPGRPVGTFRKKPIPIETEFGIWECKNYEVSHSQRTNILEDFGSEDFEPKNFDDVDWDALEYKLLM